MRLLKAVAYRSTWSVTQMSSDAAKAIGKLVEKGDYKPIGYSSQC